MVNEMLKRIVRLLLPCKNVGKSAKQVCLSYKVAHFMVVSVPLCGEKQVTSDSKVAHFSAERHAFLPEIVSFYCTDVCAKRITCWYIAVCNCTQMRAEFAPFRLLFSKSPII